MRVHWEISGHENNWNLSHTKQAKKTFFRKLASHIYEPLSAVAPKCKIPHHSRELCCTTQALRSLLSRHWVHNHFQVDETIYPRTFMELGCAPGNCQNRKAKAPRKWQLIFFPFVLITHACHSPLSFWPQVCTVPRKLTEIDGHARVSVSRTCEWRIDGICTVQMSWAGH